MLALILGLALFRLRLALLAAAYICADHAEVAGAMLAEWWRVQFATDDTTGWDTLYRAQHRPEFGHRSVRATIGRRAMHLRPHHTVHALGVARGTLAQLARWTTDTQTMPAVA